MPFAEVGVGQLVGTVADVEWRVAFGKLVGKVRSGSFASTIDALACDVANFAVASFVGFALSSVGSGSLYLNVFALPPSSALSCMTACASARAREKI